VYATGVTTTLNSGGGYDTVDVRNAGSVQGIHGAQNVENLSGYSSLFVNDSADVTARNVTLGALTSGVAAWSSITGLAPASINYRYYNTHGVSITTGLAAATVNVYATDATATTSLSSGGGYDTVNVGIAGTLQLILGVLNIENPPSHTTLNIDDSADATARPVTLGTFTPDGTPWGSITGPAPAAINFHYADISSNTVNLSTYYGCVTWNVYADALASFTGVVVKDNGLEVK
jgi:hypothetical protein